MKTKNRLRIALLCIVLTRVLIGHGTAEVLYDQDGIVLEGTARKVAYGIATCRVLEEKQSPEVYERMKVNDGEALDLWQMTYSVHNGTGKELASLTAKFHLHSEWPPCTNWEESPESPAAHIQYQWAGHVDMVVAGNGMRVGQTVHQETYLLVFRGQEPFFKEWEVRFRSDADTKANQGEGSPPERTPVKRTPTSQPKAAPPKDAIEFSNKPGCYFLPFFGDHHRFQWSWTGECVDGWAQGEGTVRADRGGKELHCEHSGQLQKGRKEGHWVETCSSAEVKWGGEGSYVNGRREGRWIQPRGNSVSEGSYVDGRMQGHWVIRTPSLNMINEGPYVDGKRHGKWITRRNGVVVLKPFMKMAK